MKNIINGDFEKLVLDGCTLLQIESLNYNSKDKEYTHALFACPKNYRPDEYKDRGCIKFVSVKYGDDFINPAWYEATVYFANKSHALKSFREDLREDRSYRRLAEQNKATS